MLRAAIAVLFVLAVVSSAPASQIHFYNFNTGALDSAGTANGTLLGGATVSGGYLHLNGASAYVQCGQHIVPTSGSYTVALFAFETQPTGNYIELISQGFSGAGFYIGHSPGGVIRVGDAWINTGVPFPSDSALHHYAVVVDGTAGTSKLYIDGALAASINIAIGTTTGGTDTRFGRQFDPFGEFFNGGIDDVRIYDNALSASEVSALAGGQSQVPEPGTMVLLGTGLLGAFSYFRQHRNG